MAATPNFKCNNFNVKMACSGGAETALPEESDPQGFSVDTKTGAITGTPKIARDGYTYRMQLRAVDAADVRTTVADWAFNVRKPPAFKLNPSAEWSMETDGRLESKYHVAETHLLPKPPHETDELLQDPAGGFDKVVYLLSIKPATNNPACDPDGGEATQGGSNKLVLTDVATGEGAINIKCEGNYTAKLAVRDGAGAELTIRSWEFQVLRRDTDVSAYGPGGRGCTNGDPIDGNAMDSEFTCDCSATKFTGDNCDVEDNTTVYVIIAVLAVLTLGAAIIVLLVRYQRYQQSIMATDFLAQLQNMKDEGLVDSDQISTERVPRELKRAWLSFIDKIGQGQFGEVWKGLLKDGDNTAIPEYMVAAKTVKEAESNEATVIVEGELMKEALLMAQVEPHTNLVSIIGVITRGRPKTLVRDSVTFLPRTHTHASLFLVGPCSILPTSPPFFFSLSSRCL